LTAFTVEWTREAMRDLRALHPEVQLRVVRKVERAKQDPLRYFERLKGDKAWRLRVGDWRVLADIVLTERKVVVATVGHRRNVYR